jgi:hypothetical protein
MPCRHKSSGRLIFFTSFCLLPCMGRHKRLCFSFQKKVLPKCKSPSPSPLPFLLYKGSLPVKKSPAANRHRPLHHKQSSLSYKQWSLLHKQRASHHKQGPFQSEQLPFQEKQCSLYGNKWPLPHKQSSLLVTQCPLLRTQWPLLHKQWPFPLRKKPRFSKAGGSLRNIFAFYGKFFYCLSAICRLVR